jgi:hypothetical protein
MPRIWEMAILLVYGVVNSVMYHSGRYGHPPSAFSNDTRLSNLHSNQVTKRAQSDEQVEDFYAFGMAKDIGEEETRDRHTRRPDVVFRY